MVLCVLLVLTACARHEVDLSRQAPATAAAEPGGYETAEVTRIVDGDTVEVRITGRNDGPGAGRAEIGQTYSVRLIGIDTPESVKPGSPVECFGREASAATKALLGGAEVALVKDIEETDRYDRLLRYVYLGGEMVNARLVLNGYAHAYTYPPNVRHSDLLVDLQRQAREGDRGLWSADSCSGQALGHLVYSH
ncbi:MAG: thermonuclease family protein [Actinomycetota bacterium]